MVINPAELEAQLPDKVLVDQAATGDRMAYNVLIRRWQQKLWRIARRYTGDPSESEDIVQDVFVAFWRTLAKDNPSHVTIPRDVGAFLGKATLNACRDWSRRRAVRAFFFQAIPLDPARLAQDERDHDSDHTTDLDVLDHMIAHLPDRLKAPLILCAIEGLSQRHAADILGLTPKAVETRIRRGKEQLRKLWPKRDEL